MTTSRRTAIDADYIGFAKASWSKLVRSAVLLGCSPQEAEDATQETLLKCYRSWPRVTRADDVDAYVYTMLLNTIRSSTKRRPRRPLSWEQLPPTARETQRHERVDERVASALSLREALDRLEPTMRRTLVLRFWADMTEQQAAVVLGVAVGTVKSRTSRAIAALASDPAFRDATNWSDHGQR